MRMSETHSWPPWIKSDPVFRDLRTDRRFRESAKKSEFRLLEPATQNLEASFISSFRSLSSRADAIFLSALCF